MAVEMLGRDKVVIDGYIVELFDDRESDPFDIEAEAIDRQLQAVYDVGLRDTVHPLMPSNAGFRVIDPTIAAYQQLPRFLSVARRAAAEAAVSYRGFHVGAAAMALSVRRAEVAYLYGGNLTPYKGAPKRCAEMEIIAKADMGRYDRLLAMAVFGPNEFSDVQALPASTLHPCGACRDLMRDNPLTPDDMLLITSNRSGAFEIMLKRDMLALHES